MTQRAFVHREKARPSRPAIGETLIAGVRSYSQVHVSPTAPKSHGVPDVVVLDGFPRGPLFLSFLPLYSDHVGRHMWKGQVA